MSYEKDKLDSYLTSASLTTALAPYVTSDSLSAAIAGLNLAPYMTSDSISAAVATDVLTVRGAASVSATMSAAAVTVAGRPLASVTLGYADLNNVTQIGFSGSWSDIAFFEFRAAYTVSSSATASIQLFTDGGTTPILALNVPYSTIGGIGPYGEVFATVNGVAGRSRKSLLVTGRAILVNTQSDFTLTANAGYVNCIRLTQSRTMSGGFAILIGYRNI